MDTRNEYRISPSIAYEGQWVAEFRFERRAGIFSRRVEWSEWKAIDYSSSPERAEAMCRRHAGEGTKYLGRLP